MPVAAPLLAHGRVLCAADRRHGHVARDADVAADALADVLDPPLLDLARQEGVGDRGPGGADQVEHAAPDLRDHGVRRGEAADADHRLACQLLDAGDKRLLRALLAEAGGLRIIRPIRQGHVPNVWQIS
jgi:hypothetical protein